MCWNGKEVYRMENTITFEDIQKANETIKPISIERKDKETGKKVVKKYAEVNQRIKAFRMVYPMGTIETEILKDDDNVCMVRASIYNGDILLSTATAREEKTASFINKTNYVENCETSAVGRALGMCGFGIDVSVASAEEIQNSIQKQEKIEKESNLPMTEEQMFMTANLEGKYKDQLRKFYNKDILDLTRDEAETSINSLKAKGVEIKTKNQVELDRKKEEEVF